MTVERTDAARFASKIAGDRARLRRGDCWRWTGAFDRNGYGTFSVGGKTVRAHRFAFEAHHGRAPSRNVLHKCGHRWCVNPHHLRDGTRVENVQDMRRHGTLATGNRNGARRHPERIARGDAAGAAKLSEAQVRKIRRQYSRGEASLGEIAREHKVHKSTISRAISGQQWRHV